MNDFEIKCKKCGSTVVLVKIDHYQYDEALGSTYEIKFLCANCNVKEIYD